MGDRPILICYSGTEDDGHAIEAAAALLGTRRAVVLNIAPAMTPAESFAAATSVLPGNAFEDLNTAGAREQARAGAELAARAGFEADARGDTAPSTGKASSASPTRSTRRRS
jgi:hypothetical protein